MGDAGTASLWGALVLASLVVGAVAAARLRLPERIAATITAFGGGTLFSAVAFDLVPEADQLAGRVWTAAGLLGGAAVYVAADAWLTRDSAHSVMRRAGHAAASGRPMRMPHSPEAARGEAIAAGIVVDGVPESLALGLMAADGHAGLALLVAVVVGNLTEAYGAAQPIVAGGHSRCFALSLLSGIGLVLGVVTLLGGTVLGSAPDTFVGAAQAVAGGAVLAVLSISIVPYAFDEARRSVALATALGFTVGYLLG
jgi:ZIP family zinc transporter